MKVPLSLTLFAVSFCFTNFLSGQHYPMDNTIGFVKADPFEVDNYSLSLWFITELDSLGNSQLTIVTLFLIKKMTRAQNSQQCLDSVKSARKTLSIDLVYTKWSYLSLNDPDR